MSKLLLADDSITIQRVIELTFSGEDVHVIPVGDGEQAIARIPLERPDIVLADIGMPKRSGYDVAAFVKGQPDLAHIPVLLLAGAFEPVDDARAAQVKCDGVLVKPFEPQQVIARVRELLDGARGTPIQAAAGVPRPVERLAPRSTSEQPPTAAALAGGPTASSTSSVNDTLDQYFDRLDEAFANLSAAPVPAAAAADEPGGELPTVDKLLASRPIDMPLTAPPAALPVPPAVMPPPVEPPDAPRTLAPAPSPVAATAGAPPRSGAAADKPDSAAPRNPVADAFSALLAVELGEPGARPVRLVSGPQEPVVTDALVDEVTRRVLQRLGPEAVKDVVGDIVSDVAERLVRQEIARIRERR
jgi:CheY-like chemotaxis protein